MTKFRNWFNKLPAKVQIIFYNTLSGLLGYVITYLTTGNPFDWRNFIAIGLGGILNVIAYLQINIEKK